MRKTKRRKQPVVKALWTGVDSPNYEYHIDYEGKRVWILGGYEEQLSFDELTRITDPAEFLKRSFHTHKIIKLMAVVFMVARDQLMEEGIIQ